MSRVSEKELKLAVEALNQFFELPVQPWTDGKSNIGHIKLDSAYGLEEMYAPEAVYALKNEMDGKFLAEVSNAFYTVGKLDVE